MEKIILTNMCLIENKKTKEVLTINRVKDWWGVAFPGGHIEEGEPIVLSVLREIKEETNIDIDNLIFCGIRDWYDPVENERNIVFMFKTSTYSGNLIEDNVEGKLQWRKLDEIKEEEFSEGLYKEMGVFFDNVNEYYSCYDVKTKTWQNKKF